jgi:Domain of unknown function (DUF3854)
MPNPDRPLLIEEHLSQLMRGSGIHEDVIHERGYRSILPPGGYAELKPHGFARSQANLPGLLLPLWTTDGQNGLMVYRPDHPRHGNNHRPIKYEIPKGFGVRLDCPPRCRRMLEDPSIQLWVTEGQKKADALAGHGLCAIALLGVWNFKGQNPFGGTTLLADWDYVALNNRSVCIVFDNDTMRKSEVRKALDRLKEHLQRKHAHVGEVYLPQEHGQKIGVDDYLLTHTIEDLQGLAEQPRPQPKAAPTTMKILDEMPAELSRPLALIGDHSYAATWLPVETTMTEYTNKEGNIVVFDPPRVSVSRDLFVMRDDGALFGKQEDPQLHQFSELHLTIKLPEIPMEAKLWSPKGIKHYLAGQRPEPKDVFTRLCATISRFIDFSRSLAPQETMSEMVACYILSTWFLDAFTVIGFLWPNGERGSGKTQLLNIIAELSYLGQMILSGGSYASLRDLADYGALLAFDEAEALSDPKQTDPDKRALLLAGNRRGSCVTVKELATDKVWRTRYVNTFCPRIFSAIRLPDQVLASRSIVVPLIRTPDPERANADPLDYELWPHD